jgi:peptidoglycan hydrolase CwlO-like protein
LCNEKSSLQEQVNKVNQLQARQNTEITNLKNQLNSKENAIANLKSQLPQIYKVIVNQAYCYKLCAGRYVYIDCIYNRDSVINIYATQQGYGLTYSGWVKLSDLEKY